MIEHEMTLVEFLNEYSFDDDAHYESSMGQRLDFRDTFPLQSWTTLSPEDYAINKKRDTICYRLQYSTGNNATGKIGGMNLGSQKNALIYRESESGKMYYPPEYESLEKAWDAIRDGFLRLFDSAQRGDWVEASKNEVVQKTHGIRMKLLSIYFPEDVLAIFSKKHLKEFLEIFEVPSTEYSYGEDIITLNRKFLGVLRARGFEQSPIRISHGIYLWRDAKKLKESKKSKKGKGSKKSIKVGRRFWIEKAQTKTERVVKEEIGKVLISPLTSSTGSDIYANMRKVRPDDLVLHLIDNDSIAGVSIVDNAYEGLEGRQELRVALRDYLALTPVLHRETFLNASTLKEFLGPNLFRSSFLLAQPLPIVNHTYRAINGIF